MKEDLDDVKQVGKRPYYQPSSIINRMQVQRKKGC